MKTSNRLKLSPKLGNRLTLKIAIISTSAGAVVLCGVLLIMAANQFTHSIKSGDWGSASVWSDGVPDSDAQATINHMIFLNKDIIVEGKGYYTINSPALDLPGAAKYGLTISGNSSKGTFEVKARTTFEGSCNVNNKGELIIRTGDTLEVGATVFANGSSVIIDEGGILIVNGNLQNKNNSKGIVVNGALIVRGDFTGGNGSAVSGDGDFTTTGSMTGAGTVFGSPINCPGPGCDGRNLSGFTNTIGSPQTICFASVPAALTGSTTAISPVYQWQFSLDNNSYMNILGANKESYSPAALLVTTWFRRKVTASGKSSISASVKITVSTGGIWTGSASSSWNNAANWCGGKLPTSATDVLINAGCPNMPSVTGTSALCNHLTIMPQASLTLKNGSILNVKGNWNNLGIFTDEGATIIFSGTSFQKIYGESAFGAMTINNSSQVILNAPMLVNGILSLLKGELVSNSNLTINLNSGGIAYASTDLGSITGKITTRRDVSTSKYHYLSSPLSGQKFTDWNDNIPLGSGYTYYYYDETNKSTDYLDGWMGIRDPSAVLIPMKGYALYFKTPVRIDNSGTYTHGISPAGIDLTHTHTGDNGADGWNLVGNPYPSTIDWDASAGWTKTNIYDAIYCWDPVNNRYTCYANGISINGGSRWIAAMQAFWVRVDTTKASGKLDLTSAARTKNSAVFYRKKSASPVLKIAAGNGTYEDEVVVRLTDEATDDFDGNFDAFKMMNEGSTPSIYTAWKNNLYAINSLPEPEEEMVIPLVFKTDLPGTYTFSVKEMTSFDNTYSVLLEDKILKTTENLKHNSRYSFLEGSQSSTPRFNIRIVKNVATSIHQNAEEGDVTIKSDGRNIFFNLKGIVSEKASFVILTTAGTELTRKENVDMGSGTFTYEASSLNTGIYIVRLMVNGKLYTSKVFIE